jgi:4-amino-4-deoxy-L-arabinose transferase-like glycosyltransferase
MELADPQMKRTGTVVGHTDRNRQRLTAVVGSLVLVLLTSLIIGALAYQTPPSGRVPVGWPGDRLFLNTSPGLGIEARERGDFYADDLTPDSPTGRSRWTRSHARIVLPNIGAGAALNLRMTVQGWPADALNTDVAQPQVAVYIDGDRIGTFVPTTTWNVYQVQIPAEIRTQGDLTIDLMSSHTFQDTISFGRDPRPKGVRLAEVQVVLAEDDPTRAYPPAWPAVGLLAANAVLLYLLLARLLPGPGLTYACTTICAGIAGVGLALIRIWMGAALGLSLFALAAAIAIAWRSEILAYTRALVRSFSRGRALGYGLVTIALILFGASITDFAAWFGTSGGRLFWQVFPDSLLFGLFAVGLAALTLNLGHAGLPRLSDRIVGAIGSRRGALSLLTLFGVIWIGYQAYIVFQLPYVGHADYADNAVVARNLVAGRGWVVDYVTQFYRLYPGLTRPQETWPLLQPVWIAPFFALFGTNAWVAKLPNLLFNLALIGLIYHAGAHLWDRRIGLTAAILTLTSYLFFRLTIYVTSDLAFVVLCFAAIWLLYRAIEDGQHQIGDTAPEQPNPPASTGKQPFKQWRAIQTHPAWSVRLRHVLYRRRFIWLSGLCTGLMMLQKPSGALIAVGMGLWFIGECIEAGSSWRGLFQSRNISRIALTVLPWTLTALLVLAPYLARNLQLFGRPVYSTESHDAWVLGYRGTGGDAWEEIYRVFTPELAGPGIPDRSWILRWGFDATLTKFQTQLRELRDYLLPAWGNAPDPLNLVFGEKPAKNLLSGLGAWLALVGLIGALRARRRMIGLLTLGFGLYMAFMLTYWRTDEHRYWVMLIPWLALLAGWTIWAGYDRLAAINDRRWAPLGLVLALTAIIGIVGFSRSDIADKVRNEPARWQPDLVAYAWIAANTEPDTALMTRLPWQLNWHTERPAVMIPNTDDRELLLTIANYYGAEYLVLENLQRVKGDAGRLLNGLMNPGDVQPGVVIDGFELVYVSPGDDFRAFVYRLPQTE